MEQPRKTEDQKPNKTLRSKLCPFQKKTFLCRFSLRFCVIEFVWLCVCVCECYFEWWEKGEEVPSLIPDKLRIGAYLIHRRPKSTLEVSLINACFFHHRKAFTSNFPYI